MIVKQIVKQTPKMQYYDIFLLYPV